MDVKSLPRTVDAGAWGAGAGHLQGIAMDDAARYMYFSFTDRLVKVDMRTGDISASVVGLLSGGIFGGGAHLGCLAFYDGKVYGSLEYKAAEKFYVAVFDVDKMTEMDMDYRTLGVMSSLYMDEVARDYADDLDAGEHENNPRSMGHRHGCSGIDGITFGTIPGDPSGRAYMLLAYGIYGNTSREDNDNQVLLAFDPEDFQPLPFDQNNPHTSAPQPSAKFFVYTGNTTYGVQNLEFDRDTGDYWMICYSGQKDRFANHPVYIADGAVRPVLRRVEVGGRAAYGELAGQHLSLKPIGQYDAANGIWGIDQMPGNADTGFISLGDGYFYVAESGRADGLQFGRAHLYKLDRGAMVFIKDA